MALKDFRELANLSQRQLSELSGVNVRMIQYYEQKSKNINGAKLSTLLSLCVALRCSLSDIVTDEETLDLLSKVNAAALNKQ